MVDGTRTDDLPALSLPQVRSDRMIVGRSGDTYRNDVSQMRFGVRRRIPAKIIQPVASDFSTWVNQGSATLSNIGYGVQLASPHASASFGRFNAAVRTLPSGNWDVQLGMRKRSPFKNWHNGGIILRESATGKAGTFGWMDNGLLSSRWTGPTAYTADMTAHFEFHSTLWFRLRKFSSTQYAAYFSLDGFLWCLWDLPTTTTVFTTAPDQWGLWLQPVNEAAVNLDIRFDAFHWLEDTNLDIHPTVPTYANWQGYGDRTADITCTTDATLVDGTINNLVDGGFNNNSSDGIQVTNGQSGKHVTFQFPNAKVVTAAKWFQAASQSNGTWKWQGSNNGSSWTDLNGGATFTLNDTTAGVSGTELGDLSGNATAYLYYRLQQTAGTTSNAARWTEIEFKLMRG